MRTLTANVHKYKMLDIPKPKEKKKQSTITGNANELRVMLNSLLSKRLSCDEKN